MRFSLVSPRSRAACANTAHRHPKLYAQLCPAPPSSSWLTVTRVCAPGTLLQRATVGTKVCRKRSRRVCKLLIKAQGTSSSCRRNLHRSSRVPSHFFAPLRHRFHQPPQHQLLPAGKCAVTARARSLASLPHNHSALTQHTEVRGLRQQPASPAWIAVQRICASSTPPQHTAVGTITQQVRRKCARRSL